ncbi:MAG: haloacid dehalogenase-like hydrolase [Alphaproteobacteria bacterium]|nr:haloacid dehalogenase-like hydrolase [Alphaproteobacteria bacterium]
MKQLVNVALCYDFDGTLAAGNMQEYGFMQRLGIKPDEFWKKSDALAAQKSADKVLCYMKCMLEEAHKRDVAFRREDFVACGNNIVLFKGVTEWFDRINQYALKKGIVLSHYLISSGLEELVEGTPIFDKFDKIYASAFWYDAYGRAEWPARNVNYTEKTQYLFRINKGCLDVCDNRTINLPMAEDERPVPFSHMIYFGDGETDVPCMSMVKRLGGYSVAVYQPHKRGAGNRAEQFVRDGRVNIAVPADYSQGKKLDRYIKSVIDKIAADNKLADFK